MDLVILMAACGSVFTFYALSQKEAMSHKFYGQLKYLPTVIGVGVGLTINNSKAVLEALFGYQSAFIRTPKWAFDDVNIDDVSTTQVIDKKSNSSTTQSKSRSFYHIPKTWMMSCVELTLAVYYIYTCYYCIIWQRWSSFPLLVLFTWGLVYVAIYSLMPTIQVNFHDSLRSNK